MTYQKLWEVRPLKYKNLWLVVGILGVVLVVVLSLASLPQELKRVPFVGDKILHVLAYMVLMFWFGAIYVGQTARWLFGLGFVTLGITLEFAQLETGFRTFEYGDMVANGLGVLVGWLLAGTRLSLGLIMIERVIGKQ